MKPLVIYHKSCADGFGAAFAAWLSLGDDVDYIPVQYGSPEHGHYPTLIERASGIEGREVYILDFSFPKPLMDDIFATAKRVVWLDHHKTAFEMWCGKYEKGDIHLCNRYGPTKPCEIVLDDNKSGAMLAWEYFHPNEEFPMAIRHIDDYDRWVFALEGTKEFNKALWSYAPWSFEHWLEMFGTFSINSGVNGLIDEGAAILRAHNQNVQSVVKGAARACSIIPAVIDSVTSYKSPWTWWNDPEYGDTCGANGLAANCPPHLSSDVGHELATQSGTFGLLWCIDKNGKCKCSLRSNPGYDVSIIAKAFGGGGHATAAGFEVDIHTLLGWLK